MEAELLYLAEEFIDITRVLAQETVLEHQGVGLAGSIAYLAKAIQSAGGFTLYAKETAVRLARENGSYTIDVKLAQKNPSQDPRLMPGDSLQVARSPF